MKILLGLLHCQILLGVCGNDSQMVKQLDQLLAVQFLRYFLKQGVRVFVSAVFSRRSAKTSSPLNIMLLVVSLVNGC